MVTKPAEKSVVTIAHSPQSAAADAKRGEVEAAAKWHRQWGPTKVPAKYFKTHTKWVSNAFVAKGTSTGVHFNCDNGGDGAMIKAQIWDVENRKYVPIKGNKGYQLCNGAGKWIQTKKSHKGNALKVVLLKKGQAHTVYELAAYDWR